MGSLKGPLERTSDDYVMERVNWGARGFNYTLQAPTSPLARLIVCNVLSPSLRSS